MQNQPLQPRRHRLFKLSAFVVCSTGVLLTVFLPTVRAGWDVMQSPSKSLVALNMKFNGASSCNNSHCHGAADAGAAPGRPGNEYNVWLTSDKHHEAYKTLSSKKSADIAKASQVGNPATSDACLSCHALNAPPALHGSGFQISEGVTCNACHGPSDKWLAPHSKPGWLKAQYQAYPDQKTLLAKEGIFDTKPVLARAERCTSCHLAIDSKLIKAGHPQPLFEIAYFSDAEPKHWRDPAGLFATKLWATGQAVCLRDAALQVALRLKSGDAQALIDDAVKQSESHYQMLESFLTVVDAKSAGDLKAASTGFEKNATQASALADVAAKIAEKVSTTEVSDVQTLAVLKSVSNLSMKPLGLTGQLQQAEGVYELYTAYSTSKGLSDDAGSDAISKLLPTDNPSGPLDPAYETLLKTAKTHLPK